MTTAVSGSKTLAMDGDDNSAGEGSPEIGRHTAMRRPVRILSRQRNPIERAIHLAAVAGACRIIARDQPDTASGLNKAADGYSRQAARLISGLDE